MRVLLLLVLAFAASSCSLTAVSFGADCTTDADCDPGFACDAAGLCVEVAAEGEGEGQAAEGEGEGEGQGGEGEGQSGGEGEGEGEGEGDGRPPRALGLTAVGERNDDVNLTLSAKAFSADVITFSEVPATPRFNIQGGGPTASLSFLDNDNGGTDDHPFAARDSDGKTVALVRSFTENPGDFAFVWQQGSPAPASNVRDIFVPAGNAVSLARALDVDRLVIATGASVDLGANALTLSISAGSVLRGTLVNGGHLIAGSVVVSEAADIAGSFPLLTVSSNVALIGPTSVAGRFAIDGQGAVDLGGFQLVANALNIESGASLAMTHALDEIVIGSGGVTVSTSTNQSWSAGTIVVEGGIDTGASGSHVTASGTHLVVLDAAAGTDHVLHVSSGAALQDVVLETPGSAQIIGGTVVNGIFEVHRGVARTNVSDTALVDILDTLVDRGAALTVNNLAVRRALTVTPAGQFAAATVHFQNPGGSIPGGLQYVDVDVEAPVSPTGTVALTGDLSVGAGGTLRLAGHNLDVRDLTVLAGGGLVQQQSENISARDARFGGGGTVLTDGVLTVARNFTEEGDGGNSGFDAAATHVTRFTGGSQINPVDVTGQDGGLGFGSISVEGHVRFQTPAAVAGNVEVFGHLVVGVSGSLDGTQGTNTITFHVGSSLTKLGTINGFVCDDQTGSAVSLCN